MAKSSQFTVQFVMQQKCMDRWSKKQCVNDPNVMLAGGCFKRVSRGQLDCDALCPVTQASVQISNIWRSYREMLRNMIFLVTMTACSI